VELVALGSLCGKAIGTLIEESEGIRFVNALAFSSRDAMLDPLPKLASGYFGSGSILPVFINSLATILNGLFCL
jgi:hypothetical protein